MDSFVFKTANWRPGSKILLKFDTAFIKFQEDINIHYKHETYLIGGLCCTEEYFTCLTASSTVGGEKTLQNSGQSPDHLQVGVRHSHIQQERKPVSA